MKSFEEILKDELKAARFVLNIGAGKWDYAWMPEGQTFIVNVDRSYGSLGTEHPADVLLQHRSMEEKTYEDERSEERIVKFVTSDLFEFVESYPLKFDLIVAARIFEHQYHDDGSIGRLMYACYSLLKKDGIMLILVPNHLRLCEAVVLLESQMRNIGEAEILGLTVRATNIMTNILQSEIFSTRSDPHGSLWTPELARAYVQTVDGLEIERIDDVLWEGRKCYMALTLKKNDGTGEKEN